MVLEAFMKNLSGNYSFDYNRTKYHEFYSETYVRGIVAGDINSP